MTSPEQTRPQQTPNKVVFEDVSKVYEKSGSSSHPTSAIESLNLAIKTSEIVSILGPSGCGKSTALNMIAGFEFCTGGRILLDDHSITAPGPDRAVVFQQASLFPWLTVFDNVVFGVKSRGLNEEGYLSRAEHLIEAVKLSGFEDHYPYQLSGGMQQRVQIARALIGEPEVLLMDEPFGALDSQTRLLMQELLLQLWSEYKSTIFFITHDVAEAIFISDRILLMTRRPGKIKLELTVDEAKPRDSEFFGSERFMKWQSELMRSLKQEMSY